jgi:FkbM family methyltransferase
MPHNEALSFYHRVLQRTLMRIRPAPVAAMLKRLLGVQRIQVKTAQGVFKVDPVSLMGIALTHEESYEEGMTATLAAFLRDGSTFIDLGANEGYFSVIGGRLCGSAGKVLAIEPQSRLQQVIADNLALNGRTNVILLHAAISDHAGTATLHLTSTTNSGGSGFHRHTKYKLPTQEIVTMTLEDALDASGIATADLMKVDIEGHEYEALLGSPKVFEQHRIKAIALELHPTILAGRGKRAEDITHMLERCGYTLTEAFGNMVWRSPAK